MTDLDRLAELKARAEKAVAVAKDLELLHAANPHKSGVRLRMFDVNTDKAFLPDNLLLQVIAMGQLGMIGKKEAELAALLGESDP